MADSELLSLVIQYLPPNLTGKTAVEISSMLTQELVSSESKRQQNTLAVNPPIDLPEFFTLLNQVIEQKQIQEGVASPVHLLEDYPPIDASQPIITYGLSRREPGLFSNHQPFAGGVKNYRPEFREAFEDPLNPGYLIVVMGQWFDNLVDLVCWAQTNKEANRLVDWLEDLMLSNTWFFRMKGITQLLYWGRQEDSKIDRGNIRFMARPLQYYIRTEKLLTISQKTIETILVNLDLAP
jgi:hypothetical protein